MLDVHEPAVRVRWRVPVQLGAALLFVAVPCRWRISVVCRSRSDVDSRGKRGFQKGKVMIFATALPLTQTNAAVWTEQ